MPGRVLKNKNKKPQINMKNEGILCPTQILDLKEIDEVGYGGRNSPEPNSDFGNVIKHYYDQIQSRPNSQSSPKKDGKMIEEHSEDEQSESLIHISRMNSNGSIIFVTFL